MKHTIFPHGALSMMSPDQAAECLPYIDDDGSIYAKLWACANTLDTTVSDHWDQFTPAERLALNASIEQE